MSKLSEMMNKAAAQLSETTSQLGEMAASTASQLSEIANERVQALMASSQPTGNSEVRHEDIYETQEKVGDINMIGSVNTPSQRTLFSLVKIPEMSKKEDIVEIQNQIKEQLDKGANPLLKDEHGKTAFDYISTHENEHIKDILSAHVIATERKKDEIGLGSNPMKTGVPTASIVPTISAIPVEEKSRPSIIIAPKTNPLAKHARVTVAEAVSAPVAEEITIAKQPLDKATLGKTFVKGNPLKSQAQRQ